MGGAINAPPVTNLPKTEVVFVRESMLVARETATQIVCDGIAELRTAFRLNSLPSAQVRATGLRAQLDVFRERGLLSSDQAQTSLSEIETMDLAEHAFLSDGLTIARGTATQLLFDAVSTLRHAFNTGSLAAAQVMALGVRAQLDTYKQHTFLRDAMYQSVKDEIDRLDTAEPSF